jgi:hypothetical protein
MDGMAIGPGCCMLCDLACLRTRVEGNSAQRVQPGWSCRNWAGEAGIGW